EKQFYFKIIIARQRLIFWQSSNTT
uniref:Uncharacterized protein n=1 Tax=Amphimedon queenslandica TaxID=400682 RepID=A0A1X7UDX4_AMPQE